MEQIKIVQPPEGKWSWVNEIVSIPIGDKIRTPKKFAKTVKPIISRDVKIKDPNGEFETDSKSDPDYLIIERIK